MAANSAIQWTDATWNPLAGCTPVSDGCRNCYAASMALRLEAMGQEKYRGTARRVLSDGRAVFTGRVNLDHGALEVPLKWKRPRRIFVNSMSDLFHEAVPDHFILEVFAMMERCPQHIFQVLTKRPARMAEWVQKHQQWVDYAAGDGEYLRRYGHVWVGASVEHQQAADERIPHLLEVPARVRFLSCEPLLGPVDLTDASIYTRLGGAISYIHWVIAGGESGHGARPMGVSWLRSLRDQCQAANVSFFLKQFGEWAPYQYVGTGVHDQRLPESNGSNYTQAPDGTWLVRIGKHAAGRLLDGVEHNAYPA